MTGRPGLQLLYDSYGIPHVYGQTREDVAFGAGWTTARDRGLLLLVGRGPARVAYERLGRRNPLPVPTTLEERRGRRPRDYERRLSNGQAAIGLGQLRNLEKNLEHRAFVASAYRGRLSGCGLRLPQVPAKAEPSFVLRATDA